MALDLLLLIMPIALTVLFIWVFSGSPIPKTDSKQYPPNPLHPWKGKHPDSSVTNIEYKRKNENGLTLWKFRGYSEEVPAQPGFDVFADDGAEAGQPSSFFHFRYNPDHSEQPYANPSFRQYFELMNIKKQEFYEKVAEKERGQEYKQESRKSISRSIEDAMDLEFSENVYSMDKKMLEVLLTKKGSHLPSNSGGVGVAETGTVRKE